jgi:hypothetical protein
MAEILTKVVPASFCQEGKNNRLRPCFAHGIESAPYRETKLPLL